MPPVLTQSLLAGGLAGLLSSAVLALAGKREAGSAAAPANAISHWYWDDEALHRDRTDLAHTGLGLATHMAASVFWAGMYAVAARRLPASRTLPGILGGAAATSATACFVDFQCTPRRLTPGFEHRLSSGALAATYAAFGAGLALGAYALRDSYPESEPDTDTKTEPPEAEEAAQRNRGDEKR